MTQKRLLFFFLILLFIAAGTYFLIQVAKGYRFNLSQKNFEASGLLVATSSPDGGQIFINGKLQSATNTTIYLAPGTYEVEIKKDGFHSWKKTFKVEKEMVSRADAWLFPLVPDFKALTYTSAADPLLSPDGTKVIYKVTSKIPEKDGLWILDLADLPFGISREPKQIVKNVPRGRDFTQATYLWSPDSRQILLTFKQAKTEENFFLDPNTLNLTSALVDVTANLPLIKKQWQIEEELKQEQKLAKLPPTLKEILEEKAKNIIFSPDETKVLYVASASATISDNLISPIHSFSNQPQERQLKDGQTYVYDIKEDRNFLILKDKTCLMDNTLLPTPTPTPVPKAKSKTKATTLAELPTCTLGWVPNSKHLFLAEKDKISIMEYEGTNPTVVYEGSYQFPFAFPFPAANRILILTTLTNAPDASPNLYAVSLK